MLQQDSDNACTFVSCNFAHLWEEKSLLVPMIIRQLFIIIAMCFLQISNADEKFPPNEVGHNPATPIDHLLLEAKSTAEVNI